MALARWQASIVDQAGNVLPSAEVEVRNSLLPGKPKPQLYSDRAGTMTIGNPIQADANGFVGFYVAGGFYDITATFGALSIPWTDVAIGLAAGTDVLSGDTPIPREVTEAGDVGVVEDDRAILVNKTAGEATNVNLPTALGRTAAVTVIDGKGDAATNPITVNPDGSETINGSPNFIIDFNHGAATFRPLPDGSGWFVT